MNGNWNQPAYIALSLDENYNIISNETLVKEVIMENDEYDKNKIERLLKEFVLKSNYEEFYNSHKSFYEKIIKSYKESISKYNPFDDNFIQDFYGYKVGNMSIKLYNFTSGSMGTLINDNQYYIQRVDNIGKDEDNFIFKPKMFTMIHEFSHPYINPLVEKYFSDIDCSSIYEEIITSANNSVISENYVLLSNDKAYQILAEYLVRTVTVVIGRKFESKEKIDKEIQNQIDKGFIHIEYLIKLFDKKDNYNTFEEFFENEIVNYILDLKEKLNVKSK